MKVRSTEINTKFKYPFTISKGTKTHQPALLVELNFNGIRGYGEAPAIAYYNIPVAKMAEDLELKKMFVEKFSLTTPDRYWHYLHHLLPQNNFLVCALDIAAWDIYGKWQQKPLHKLFKANPADAPLTDYTIGIDDIDVMVRKMEETPWPIYKIKLGTDRDIEIIKALRKHTDTLFRIDANAGWTKEEALEKINVFKDLNVEFIEQPLAKDDWEGMKWLYEKSALPLIADESCVTEHDVQKCHGHFHGINIKLTKCSGITPALRMIENARKLDMKIMIGSMNETSIGSAAIAHLAPLADYVDMDGPMLLETDTATGLVVENGRIVFNENNGLGIAVNADLFE